MFRKTLVVRALAVAFGAAALTAAVGPVAYAQTSATGTIFGQVESAAGATVVIENLDTGARRTLTPAADGKYQATSMPVGRYKVILQRNGATVSTRDGVEVEIGQGSEVSFAAASLQTVQVVGRKQTIDVTNVGSTTTFSASELAKLPVANNVGAVIQLAPQTTRGDSRYGGGGAPSFGGSGASENAYYINGFPVTTLLTQVGFSQLPFNSIANAQLLTGGYSAEFGRSTGGVVNIVTKSGGNDFVFGWGLSVEPSKLRSRPKSSYYQNNGRPATDGKLRFYNEDNTQETTTESFYVGGPLIKDKVFAYFAGENIDIETSRIRTANLGTSLGNPNSSNASGWQQTNVNKPRGLLKLDWNITDANHLEYTKIYDAVRDTRTYYSFNYNTLQRGTTPNGGASYLNWGPTPVAAEQGSQVDILKYTGYFTNDLTFTALRGRTDSPHELRPAGYDPSLPQIVATQGKIPEFAYITPQGTTDNQLTPGARDTNTGTRLDLEWRLTSSNTVRAGLDYNKIVSTAGEANAGGSVWTYGQTPTPGTALDRFTDAPNSVTGNPYAQKGYYVQQTIFATKSTPTVIQSAVYIEDKWQVTDRFLLSLGLRNEAFDNRNGDNKSYIKLSKQLAPRLGASWDVAGDSSIKIFGNAGRYHVPVPTNVAIRGAGASLNTTQNFVYTGVDPRTGAPTGLTAISPVYSANNEFGQSKDPKTVAAQNMKGNYQDELAFGMETALSKSLTVGAKFTYRTLRTAIDDHCDDRPFRAWAVRNGVDDFNFGYNCALFNPGRANTFTLDIDGDGKLETINLSAEDLGFPKVKRKYVALDLFAEYPFDGKWWGKVNYTWSRNTGNTEGQLLSDIGQGDVSTTQAFDFPEFSKFADGRLPNDRTHQLKAFGFYQATPEWGIGANLLVASGRPRNCIGNSPVDSAGNSTDYSTYGSAYFYCNNQPSPRGSLGNLPPDVRLDLNVGFRPAALPGFQIKVDVFNAFNRQSIETVEERYNTRGDASVFSRYGHVESYTAPRSVKVSASFDYKF
jgi:TonB dependent receptor/TonB-dependent Receptor Plug Domain/Carboxypeptidase regulatory-like domain